MTAHLSDRRRVERALVVELFRTVIRTGARDRTDPETAAAAGMLDAVLVELLDIASSDHRAAIRRRVGTAGAVFDRFRIPGSPVAEFGLLAFHFAKILVDRDYFAIGAESEFGRALDIILPALEEAEVRNGSEIVAEERAWRALRLLQARGYFGEIRTDG